MRSKPACQKTKLVLEVPHIASDHLTDDSPLTLLAQKSSIEPKGSSTSRYFHGRAEPSHGTALELTQMAGEIMVRPSSANPKNRKSGATRIRSTPQAVEARDQAEQRLIRQPFKDRRPTEQIRMLVRLHAQLPDVPVLSQA